MNFTLETILEYLNIDSSTAADVIITAVSTDSRKITPGSLFIALVGDNFDGHDYISSALKQGAGGVLVQDKSKTGENVFFTENTVEAFLKIAGLHRSKLSTKVIAVTGSVGKTTTKEMIACALCASGKIFKTEANLNNEIGLATMLLELDNQYKYAVLELGVDGPNQMAPMSLAAAPDIAVVTNVGDAHLLAFKTKENIMKEKLQVTLGLKNKDFLFLSGDDFLLKAVKGKHYSTDDKSADIYADNITSDNLITNYDIFYKDKSYAATLPTIGKHNVLNSLVAVLVAATLGENIEEAVAALKNYKAEGMRQKIVNVNNFTVVEDAYNASPQSMESAVETLSSFQTEGRRILVLSDMLELGENEKEYHKDLGRLISKSKVDILYTIGNLSYEIYNSAKETGFENAHHYTDKDVLAEQLKAELKAADVVWFKASRGMRLEDVVEKLY